MIEPQICVTVEIFPWDDIMVVLCVWEKMGLVGYVCGDYVCVCVSGKSRELVGWRG